MLRKDSPFKIKKELLRYLQVWDQFYGSPNLNAETRKIFDKCPGLKRELPEYNVLVKIHDCKYVTLSSINSSRRVCPTLLLKSPGFISSYFTLDFVNFSNSFTTNTSGPLRAITRSLHNKF
ncbi:hypothetical protein ACKWTF_002940 [Chironomus riparius]